MEWKNNRSSENYPLAPEPDCSVACRHDTTVTQPPQQADQASNRRLNNSTGPRSPEGKLASSRNSFKHGLASGQVIVPGEDSAAFEAFLDDLLAEHQPATSTEALLVQEMAQSHWLAQRAIRLQNDCFTSDGVNEKQLVLYLRYGNTYQRAFYKALATLQAVQKERTPRRSWVRFAATPSGNWPLAPPGVLLMREAPVSMPLRKK